MADAELGKIADLLKAKELGEAEELLRLYLPHHQNSHGAWHLQGLLHYFQGKSRHSEAIDAFHRTLELKPDFADACMNLAVVLMEQECLDKARSTLEKGIRLRPNHAGLRFTLANCLRDLKDFPNAIEMYKEALQRDPNHLNGLLNLGSTLMKEGRFEEGVEYTERALSIDPLHPTALLNLGLIKRRQGDSLGAKSQFEAILSQGEASEKYENALLNLGVITAMDQGLTDEGIAYFDRLLARNPDHSDARFNRSLILLQQGRWQEGFRDYHLRWNLEGYQSKDFDQPEWDGGRLDGKRILLHAEQGLGDTIQFVRYAKQAKEAGGHVILLCQPPLRPLLRHLPWIDEFALHEFGNEFEVHAPLLSLPEILGTSPETIPHQDSYLFPPKDLVAVWSQRLRHHDGFRVGIVWRGNPGHKGDILRSTALDQFAPLAEIPGVRLLSLQHGTVPEQQDFPVDFLSDDLDEQAGAFLGLSAVLANIDLLITVDSAPAHVAGALGLPVWVALSKSPDWRWGLRGEKTDWYPSMRLFRQETAGDWSQVFRHMATKLHRQISEAGDHPSKPRTLPARHLQSFPRIHDQVHGRYGPILFNRKDAYIGKSLALYGDFSEGECDVFHQLISSGETLIEVGANIGALTVPLARFVGPKGRVIAFEPQRILYQVLCGNIAQNQLTNVEAYQKGCGAARGQMKVPPLDYTRRNNYGGLSLCPDSEGDHGESVLITPLDEISLSACHFIKIDVEGMEKEVLAGATKLLADFRPILYVENDREDRSHELIHYLDGLDYRMHWHTPKLYRSDNFFGNPVNEFGEIISRNMVCLPQEKAVSVEGGELVQVPNA